MKKLKFICLSAVVLQFAVTVYFCELRTADKQLLAMAVSGFACIVSLVSLIAGFCLFFREKLRAFVPALICIIGLPAGMLMGSHLGELIQNGRFQKNLPRYNAVVQRIEKGELTSASEGTLIKLPDEYADLARITMAKINHTNTVVEFITEDGFPVKHGGYLFVSSDSIQSDPDLLRRWPCCSKIYPNWFRISD